MEVYSLSTNFPSGIDSSKLERIINASIPGLVGITTYADNVEILFTNAIDSTQKTLLDSIVAAHLPDQTPPNNSLNIMIMRSTKLNEYELICSFILNEKVNFNINSISFTSRLSGSIMSYDIRLYDSTNNNILASGNYTNSDLQLNSINSLSNVPTSQAVLEIHAKKNGGESDDKVFINELTLYS